MKRHLVFVFSMVLVVFACQPKDEILSTAGKARVSFSADTVFFDTLFSNFVSPTKRLSIKNFNANAMNLSSVHLQNGSASFFRLTINGVATQQAQNLFLRGNDSLRIFLDIVPPKVNTDEIVMLTDFLVVEVNGNTQKLPLIAWVQDGIVLEDTVLTCQTVWADKKPYIVKGNVLVEENCRLLIESGVRVVFLPESALLIAGSLEIDGTAAAPVLLSSFRNDGDFENALGQWFGLVFGEKSTNNRISFAVIENATMGIRFGKPDNDTIPDLRVENTIIRNMADAGILCLNSDVLIQNTLVYNCLNRTIAAGAGGSYYFYHNTFVNFGFNFFRDQPSFELSNVLTFTDTLGNKQTITNDLDAYLINNIIWGSQREELILFAAPQASFQILWNSNLLKTQLLSSSSPNILNQDPKFQNAFEGNYALDSLSPAIDAGVLLDIEIDLEGKPRDEHRDIGAYER